MFLCTKTLSLAVALTLISGAASAADVATPAAPAAAPAPAATAEAAAPAPVAEKPKPAPVAVPAPGPTPAPATATAPAPAKAAKAVAPAKAKTADAAAAPAGAGATAKAKVKAAPIPVVSKEDTDLWAFLVMNSLAPGKTVADFRALPNFTGEKKDELRGTIEDNAPAEPRTGPISYRFTYTGMEVRALDYGSSAFITRLRVDGADRVIKDEVKIGGPRAAVDAALGRPVTGGGSYAVYEGKTDVIRVFFTPTGTVSAVEINHGS